MTVANTANINANPALENKDPFILPKLVLRLACCFFFFFFPVLISSERWGTFLACATSWIVRKAHAQQPESALPPVCHPSRKARLQANVSREGAKIKSLDNRRKVAIVQLRTIGVEI